MKSVIKVSLLLSLALFLFQSESMAQKSCDPSDPACQPACCKTASKTCVPKKDCTSFSLAALFSQSPTTEAEKSDAKLACTGKKGTAKQVAASTQIAIVEEQDLAHKQELVAREE